MLPAEIKSAIENKLGGVISGTKALGGGCNNHAARIEINSVSYFVKWNDSSRFPGMFEAEEKGLNLLRECSGCVIPQVIMQGITEPNTFLLLEFLEKDISHWKDAGFVLGNMHNYKRWTNTSFGLDHDNYIGSLKQSNTIHDSWKDFFTSERILPQVKLAMDHGRLSKNDLRAAENFCQRIDEIFPEEKPSLLHGDLWNGNFMFTSHGPALFDPAVYWGHREMDIAMTKLFGGFDSAFYEGYNEHYPLEKNWELRIDYCNLYPLLVHVNLFGGGYADDVKQILKPFA
jgi:protein-ribulosamine 3-kinase